MVTSPDVLSNFVNTSARSSSTAHAPNGITMPWAIGLESADDQGTHRVVLPATQEEQ